MYFVEAEYDLSENGSLLPRCCEELVFGGATGRVIIVLHRMAFHTSQFRSSMISFYEGRFAILFPPIQPFIKNFSLILILLNFDIAQVQLDLRLGRGASVLLWHLEGILDGRPP